MRKIFRSVRWRIQLWHALILLAVIAVLCVLIYRLAGEDRRERIDRELEAFEKSFIGKLWENAAREANTDSPPTTDQIRQRFLGIRDAMEFPLEMRGLFDPQSSESIYLVYWDRDGSLLFRSANAPHDLRFPSEEVDRTQKPRMRGNLRELVRGGPRGFRTVVGRDVSSDMAAQRRLALQIAASGLGLWLLGLLGGWWLGGRVIKPIAVIGQTASRIAGGNLSERIDIADTDNELGRLSRVLNQTFDRLEAAIQRQREFTADASHELRTPLTVILAETGRGLKRERTAEEYREILGSCAHAADRMRGLVESLLLLARQDDQTSHGRRQSVDLATVAADALTLVQPLANDRRITVEAGLDSAPCSGDAAALSMMIVNLLSNAILHQQADGGARLRTFSADGMAVVEIRDEGPGIAEDHLPRLFDRFYRVDASRGPAGGHSGLGLSIVKAIVENHDGSISVESEPGKGSCFRVSLPASPAMPA